MSPLAAASPHVGSERTNPLASGYVLLCRIHLGMQTHQRVKNMIYAPLGESSMRQCKVASARQLPFGLMSDLIAPHGHSMQHHIH